MSNSVTTWTIAPQAPPSMGFSRQEHWSELPFPFPRGLPDPGIEPGSPAWPHKKYRQVLLTLSNTGFVVLWNHCANFIFYSKKMMSCYCFNLWSLSYLRLYFVCLLPVSIYFLKNQFWICFFPSLIGLLLYNFQIFSHFMIFHCNLTIRIFFLIDFYF